ncbi:hypothetical protein P3X46_024440 [Hevea brasiliensis]|uniref:TIR domain-containing protein n=1 Tax=Hevea brasiliensis TaxID=3981 RepID=A0ABQ9L5U2_HEVBR|nr:hypothetical protein P3X46_024440 [Hevea brasiliensis]
MASTSSTPPDQWKTWDAFISFRGKDIRQGFLSHLFKALSGKQINAFLDENLEKGEEISSSLLETIEDSYVSVVFFSENYADSPWCLDELLKIFQCMKTSGQIVLPVFYRVDPTDVQELRGNFGGAFSKLKKEVKILERWRHALIETSNLAGWDSRNFRSESELVEEIVNVVLEKLNHIFKCDYKNDDLVGIESRVRRMESLLFSGPINDRRVVGIWGMGGIGKTTLAEEVFHRIKEKFDGHYFVANVREEIMKQTPNALRDKIFCQLLGEKDGYIDTPRLGAFTIRRLQSKKVIIVFDDVVNPNHLKLLGGVCDLYSKGSRIIITSRDRQTLKNVCLEEHIYEMYNLRILKFFNVSNSSQGQLQLPGGLEFLPEELRYLYWDRYPLNYLPLKCCTKYLVELHMPRSNLTDLWNGDEALGNLKFLDLSNSLELTRVPDLSSVPNLEVLRLSECRSLIEIPSSIGELKCLKELNLMGCSKLLSIPQSICNLKSLTLLSMSDCLNVTELPENIGDLQYLETLHILDSGIKALPSSINQLENLVSLKCKGCKGLTLPPLTGLSSLQEMELMYCGILEIPESLGFLVSLRSLFLIENNFESIPVSIKQLSKLKIFYLLGCKRLKCLPELPSCLEQLLVRCCTSLESASTSFLFPEQEDEDRIENILEFTDCINLDKEKVMENVLETHLLKHKIVRLCITGDEVPRRMRYKNQSGSSLSFTLDKPNLIGVSLCLVFDPKNHYGYHVRFICGAQFIDKSRHKIKIAKFSFRYAWMTNLLESEHVYLWNELFDMEDSFVEASFHFFIEHFSLKPQHNFEAIIKCGVLPIFRDDCLHRDKKRSRNQEDEEDEPYSLQRLKQGQKPCNSTTTTTESY